MTFDEFFSAINSVEVNTISSAFKLCLSLILGSLVGMERKHKGQIAGIRTFALISMGATLAMILSIYVPQEYLGLKNGDPGRIAAQVITGIGFLGAGAIIQMKGSVRGLTTAAGIWMIATIGMAVGVGMYSIAVLATFLILAVLVAFEQFEHRVHVGSATRIIMIEVSEILDNIDSYRKCLSDAHISITNVFINYDFKVGVTKLNFVILAKNTTDFMVLLKKLKELNPTTNLTLANQVTI